MTIIGIICMELAFLPSFFLFFHKNSLKMHIEVCGLVHVCFKLWIKSICMKISNNCYDYHTNWHKNVQKSMFVRRNRTWDCSIPVSHPTGYAMES